MEQTKKQRWVEGKLEDIISIYLDDKDFHDSTKKHTQLFNRLKSYHDRIVNTIHPDITYQNWLCDIAESIKDKDQHLAELIYVEAYKSVDDTLDRDVLFSDDRLKKCELVLKNWMNELDKEDLDPFYQLNKSKKTNESLILLFLDKVNLDYELCQHKWPDGKYTNLANRILDYLLVEADESFLKKLLKSESIFLLLERIDNQRIIETMLELRMKIVKVNSILNI